MPRRAVAPDIDHGRVAVAGGDRTVTIADRTFDATDLDVRVRHTGRVATFDLELWNLAASTFRAIDRGDPVTIQLGWDDGPTQTVCTGVVTSKDTHTTGGGSRDYAYRIRGRSRGAQAVRERVTATYRDASTHAIIRDLAARLDLDVGYLGPPPSADVPDAAPIIPGCWQLRDTHRVRAGLDALAARASEATGHQFEWYTDRGQLAFHPKRRLPDRDRDRVTMSTADTIRRLQPATGDTTHTNDVQPLRLTAYCHPGLRKHARLAIRHTTGGRAVEQGGQSRGQPSLAARDTTETYRCAEYQYASGTTIGHHTCSAVVVPDTAQYASTDGGGNEEGAT